MLLVPSHWGKAFHWMRVGHEFLSISASTARSSTAVQQTNVFHVQEPCCRTKNNGERERGGGGGLASGPRNRVQTMKQRK